MSSPASFAVILAASVAAVLLAEGAQALPRPGRRHRGHPRHPHRAVGVALGQHGTVHQRRRRLRTRVLDVHGRLRDRLPPGARCAVDASDGVVVHLVRRGAVGRRVPRARRLGGLRPLDRARPHDDVDGRADPDPRRRRRCRQAVRRVRVRCRRARRVRTRSSRSRVLLIGDNPWSEGLWLGAFVRRRRSHSSSSRAGLRRRSSTR